MRSPYDAQPALTQEKESVAAVGMTVTYAGTQSKALSFVLALVAHNFTPELPTGGQIDDPAFAEEAVRQAQEMVNLLYERPSVIAWSLHSEPPGMHLACERSIPTTMRSRIICWMRGYFP